MDMSESYKIAEYINKLNIGDMKARPLIRYIGWCVRVKYNGLIIELRDREAIMIAGIRNVPSFEDRFRYIDEVKKLYRNATRRNIMNW